MYQLGPRISHGTCLTWPLKSINTSIIVFQLWNLLSPPFHSVPDGIRRFADHTKSIKTIGWVMSDVSLFQRENVPRWCAVNCIALLMVNASFDLWSNKRSTLLYIMHMLCCIYVFTHTPLIAAILAIRHPNRYTVQELSSIRFCLSCATKCPSYSRSRDQINKLKIMILRDAPLCIYVCITL